MQDDAIYDGLDDLEPGEYNPLDHEPGYNPLRYCYLMTAIVDDGEGNNIEYELAVKFQLQLHGSTTPIDFIDPKTGKPHTVNFFPEMSEIALEPEVGPEPELTQGYQIGEERYYLVPTVHRCKHIETGRLLSRDAARHLISPDVLEAAILRYRDKVYDDPNAPAALGELLDSWDACTMSNALGDDEDDDWYDDQEDEDDSWDS